MTFSRLQYYVFILSIGIVHKTVMVTTLEVTEDLQVDEVGRVEARGR